MKKKKKDDEQFTPENGHVTDEVISLSGMYKTYFLDYASYVILERAVPGVNDGLKPVQRRILHSMKQMDDGRYHKVANIIGQTMAYHPHGDAAIGDALVNLGQKDLLIDCQGNWGDARTGDGAAAPRYIEARLTKFALEVGFNPQTTDWQLSYDGRKKEPIALPVKFPLLLAQGVEGIAVGLSTKIMPHNFIELIKASISILKGRKSKIYPDFATGGLVDVSNYNRGKRGGKIRVRARLHEVDKTTIAIRELPYGITTSNLIDSIVKANDKGKIKIKKVIDNTAKDVEILVHLAPGVSAGVTMDALYAFTNCEVSISPNACVIVDDKPLFTTVDEILKINAEQTKDLLRQELEIRQGELLEKLHFASLEKIFIENRIYREIEECETWEAVLETIDRELHKYISTPSRKTRAKKGIVKLLRDITEEDIVRLTEIKIKRISKYNTFKADELIKKLNAELKEVRHNLKYLTEYAIAYFENLLKKYGKGRERKTEITTFDKVVVTQVVANNTKLYVNRKDGFIGSSLKKDEFVCECADIDDIIVFRKDGKFMVTRMTDKIFVGKNILHVAVWKKGDDRTTYNMVYVDAGSGKSYIKRFNVTAITRNKEYDLTKGAKNSKAHYFTANPNGESEVIHIQLTQSSTARKKKFEFDFSDIEIKGRSSNGNILTKYPIRKITQVSQGKSTLGALRIWMIEASGRLNTDERGVYLGEFDTGDQLFALYNDGSYEVTELDLLKKFDPKEVLEVMKFDPDKIVNVIYYDGERKRTQVKRFKVETSKLNEKYSFLPEGKGTKLLYASTKESPTVQYNMRIKSKTHTSTFNIADFMDVKGWKALGNKLTDYKITTVKEVADGTGKEKFKAGDSVDFDVDGSQKKLF